jgi:3-hydroxyacyl-CoA dehydrogenase/enoyl-CoA hydratase/3-hydroxybutyryl-CoA epimerase/enoyl-CoA isomerase
MTQMKYEGQAIHCSILDGNIAELNFNLKDDSVNKFNALTLKELREVVNQLKADSSIQGLLLTSGKDCFIVGADITEFLGYFKKSEAELTTWVKQVTDIFSDLEDLNFPSVSAINGFALGGGFEVVLATSYRVMAADTKVGLPETKLGIYPGWGGTVRLSRLTGADNAIEWIASGEQWSAEAALKIGAVDSVVPTAQVRQVALDLLKAAMSGKLDWKARRTEKTSPLKLNQIEATLVFEGAKAFVGAKAGPNSPAPITAIEAMQKGASKNRDEALAIEAAGFVKVARTEVAHSLVSLFLGDQYLKKNSKKLAKTGRPLENAAVLGAGIMGGGIAYQSASRGVPIFMKDIAPKSLDLGMGEAVKLLDKLVSRKKMTTGKMGEVIAKIHPTLSYGDFKSVDFVVEAVVENEKVKKSVLSEVESVGKEGAILASNTSTISITRLAEGLKHPENFCGMHFFNPVHKMPLVEVIRGKKSSEVAIATAVDYALKMGKTPIVVNDCPGFLVNRVLFPYFAGFMKLVEEGVDFQRIDKVMEKFGWPMGPAYLLDVVGIDTACHANNVMAQEFPDRMKAEGKTAIDVMFEAKRFGQKNSLGFYTYTPDKKGFPKKEVDPATYSLLKPLIKSGLAVPNTAITDQEIIDRVMLPMIIECSRCLEDKIVASPVEVDMGLIYGLGFPPFRGGALRYSDSIGLKNLCETAAKYSKLGKLYEPTAQMRTLAQSGQSFYSV